MIDRLTLWLPGVVCALYLTTAIAFCATRRPSWGLVYFAYALANVGLIWASMVKA